ncbi:NAD(P)/FAD-dependent oxidoreductase [Nitrospirillum sp. BR 11828]|uniref:NAD(P)/FAD-dependent oxidoreductase n=1 Tax=Nitrospirillum sp. BR 11828 TaxID=3104325 RepID=UPI002ACA3578|nr:NAD(P)/FAD-dependent oxidoreductase [Nitrospirillum sp. BR 11828]MDZ5647955.1 NAD(P)/FAD-dependent oxidoreductase [Nitrospirillum sp. BR 11828]
MTAPTTPDVIVIGAGAAGLFTAIAAGKRGRRVVVVDHAPEAGRKILISGGGRCNFTNVDAQPQRYLSSNPHFCISALRRYTPRDFLDLVERHGIAWHEKKLGQLFCDTSARDILTMLLAEAADARVELRLGCAVGEVERTGNEFVLETAQGQMSAPKLVVATGGLSIPKMGATDFAYRLAKRWGISVVAPRPGLVPFTFTPQDLARTQGLSGVALDAVVSTGTAKAAAFREALLITHRGLSGPSILQVSSYWQPGQPITVDLTPDLDLGEHLKAAKRARPNAELKTILGDVLPRRFAERLCGDGGAGEVESRPLRDLADKALADVAARLKRWTVVPAGTEGYRTAEVTVGGIDTNDLSSKTMESKAVPGLHFVGEAVDVTGWLGGYNFQWAWSSGWVAGQAV